jgi:hypothetical protein
LAASSKEQVGHRHAGQRLLLHRRFAERFDEFLGTREQGLDLRLGQALESEEMPQ